MNNIKKITKISLILVFGLLITKAYSRNFDGTGPRGFGPKTGLEQGDCQEPNKNQPKTERFGRKQRRNYKQRQDFKRNNTRNGGLGLGINRNKNLNSQKKIKALKSHQIEVQKKIDDLSEETFNINENLK